MDDAIPRDLALKLCEQIREENARKKFGFGKMQCAVCHKVAADNPSKLCIFANETNRGCQQVNSRYRALYETRTS